MKKTKQSIVPDGMERWLAHDDLGLCLTCSRVLLFFHWSCAYDDAHNVHDKTGSAGRVSRLVTVLTDPFTRPTAPFLSERASPETRKMAELYLTITIAGLHIVAGQLKMWPSWRTAIYNYPARGGQPSMATACWKVPSTSVASSDWWWWSGVKRAQHSCRHE